MQIVFSFGKLVIQKVTESQVNPSKLELPIAEKMWLAMIWADKWDEHLFLEISKTNMHSFLQRNNTL